MPDYNSYRLANSKLTRPYQGSTLNELMKVSDVMQGRYDASEEGMDQMDEFLKNSKVLPQDQALFDQRKSEYKAKLAAWSKRGDLENVTRDVYKASRALGNEYQNFANNYKAYVTHREELDKQVASKDISKQTADAKLQMSMENYKGLKYNAKTGEYSGQYYGDQATPEVDINDWIKKVASDVAASSGKTFVERPDGFYFVGSGGKSEKIDYNTQILPAVRRAYALDPKLQSDFAQRANIAGWRGSKYSINDLPDTIGGQRNTTKDNIKSLMAQGIPESQAMQHAFTQLTQKDLVNTLEQYGSKYAYKKTESEFRYNGFTMEGEKEKKKDMDGLLSLSTTTPGIGGMNVKSAADFNSTIEDTQKQHDQVATDYTIWLQGKTKDDKTGHVYEMRDGKKVDVTDKADEFRNQMRSSRADLDNLNEIKKEAAKKAGYDPTKNTSPALIKEAQHQAQVTVDNQDVFQVGSKEAKELYDNEYNKYLTTHAPGYKEYEQALKDRMNSNAETSSILLIQDPKVQKIWSDRLKAMTSNLGLSSGALSFTIGSGPDQGKQITARQYKGIQGDVDVVGFETDANGNTNIKVRAYKDVKGAKTYGKDLLLNLGKTDVDSWLSKNMAPEEFKNFKYEGFLKKELNNKARRAEVYVPGTNITAKIKLENDKWVVSIPGQDGTNEQIATSYQGILDILKQEAVKIERVNKK